MSPATDVELALVECRKQNVRYATRVRELLAERDALTAERDKLLGEWTRHSNAYEATIAELRACLDLYDSPVE
jgi:cell division protein FtsL